MRITIFGIGYVGLVTGACLASTGHEVCCVDIDQDKIDGLMQGHIPIYEPGLTELVTENLAEGRLSFTTDQKKGVRHGSVIFIAVGTPPNADGTADLSQVMSVAETIAQHVEHSVIVVNKSTVPVGTADEVRRLIQNRLPGNTPDTIEVEVCSNPEFLKEGAAIEDFRRPDRIIVGTDSGHVRQVMSTLYSGFSRNREKIIFMDIRSAELTKYAANAMLATKISFMNEMANIAEKMGADIEQVRHGIGSDHRIGYHFIYAGCGYGGSCFPKDVRALATLAANNGYDSELLNAVDALNERQKNKLLQLVAEHYQGALQGKKIAVWGLSFKPQTNDVREAASTVVIEGLLAQGAKVVAYDPHANEAFKQYHGKALNIDYSEHMLLAIEDADALVICTEWRQFRSTDMAQVKALMKAPVIFDGRNIYDPQQMNDLGFVYYGIGRGKSVKIPNHDIT